MASRALLGPAREKAQLDFVDAIERICDLTGIDLPPIEFVNTSGRSVDDLFMSSCNRDEVMALLANVVADAIEAMAKKRSK